MIDFKKELDRILESEIDEQVLKIDDELRVTLETLNNTLAKATKKQNDIAIQTEEIYFTLSEMTDLKDNIQKLEEELKALSTEKETTVVKFIAVLDIIENFYIFGRRSSDEFLRKQAILIWNTINKILVPIGLYRIGDFNTPFDYNLNVVAKVVRNPNFKDKHITSVLKSGYIYQNKIIRKATVVVNNMEE